MTSFASRKFLLSLATLLAATVMLYLDKLTGLLWRDVVIAVCGAYLAANVTQKATQKEANPT